MKTRSSQFIRNFATKRASRIKQIPIQWPMFDLEIPNIHGNELSRAAELFKRPSQFITSVSHNSFIEGTNDLYLPDWQVPEVAFAGRSNVGKSSLLNAVVGQPDLVKTSKTPGRTQQLNFFSIGGKRGNYPDLSIVDMPGYGFAKAPPSVVKNWHELCGSYIDSRRGNLLKRMYVLIDSRRGITPVDIEFFEFLEDLKVVYQIIFSKVDCVSKAQLQKQIDDLTTRVSETNEMLIHPIILSTSSKYHYGVRILQHSILESAGLFSSK